MCWRKPQASSSPQHRASKLEPASYILVLSIITACLTSPAPNVGGGGGGGGVACRDVYADGPGEVDDSPYLSAILALLCSSFTNCVSMRIRDPVLQQVIMTHAHTATPCMSC